MRFCFTIFFYIISVLSFSQADTINQKNKDGRKHGYWMINNLALKNKREFRETFIKEEGRYENGKKVGKWITYYPNGYKKSEIEYVNNRPRGSFITYYDNGQIEEEGTWMGTYYSGIFRRFYSNGCLAQEKAFKGDGRSVLWYAYYYYSETCNKMELEYNLDSNGMFGQYTISGDTLKYQRGQPEYRPYHIIETKDEDKGVRKYTPDSLKVKSANFNMNGYNKVYNINKQIVEDGQFKDGKIWNGKIYLYDKNGFIDFIEIYKNGKYVGDAQIDD